MPIRHGVFFAVVIPVFLIGYGVHGTLPDISADCSFKQYMCAARECSTAFYRDLQKNPDDCNGAFLSVKSCMRNVLNVCYPALSSNQRGRVLDANFKERQMCTSGPLIVPTEVPGVVLPCDYIFTSVVTNCEKAFYEKFQANKADNELCRSYANVKGCVRNATNKFCGLDYPLNDIMDLALDDYNPFCAVNYRDPGATGPGYCDNVPIFKPALVGAAADLIVEPAAFALVLGVAMVDHFLS